MIFPPEVNAGKKIEPDRGIQRADPWGIHERKET
jgi:hypothetical protein